MSGPSRMLFRRVAALSVAPRTRAIGRIAVPARLPLQTSTFIEPACISSATIQYRSYAKKANKKKNTTAATAAEDNGQEVAKAFDEDKVKEKMDNIVKSLKEHYASMRVGRANPGEEKKKGIPITNQHEVLTQISKPYWMASASKLMVPCIH